MSQSVHFSRQALFFALMALGVFSYTAHAQQGLRATGEEARKSYCAQEYSLRELLRRQRTLTAQTIATSRARVATDTDMQELTAIRDELIQKISELRAQIRLPTIEITENTRFEELEAAIEEVSTQCGVRTLTENLTRTATDTRPRAGQQERDPYTSGNRTRGSSAQSPVSGHSSRPPATPKAGAAAD